MSFIVAASSPVCETELCTFRDSWEEISNLGAQVIAISNDGPFANKAFAEKNNFNFPILSDYNSKAIRDYDIFITSIFCILRTIILQNALSSSLIKMVTVVYRWVSEDPLKEPNYQEIIDFLKNGN